MTPSNRMFIIVSPIGYITEGNVQFAVRFVGGNMRMEWRGVSFIRMARFRSNMWEILRGSPTCGTMVIRSQYSSELRGLCMVACSFPGNK